MLISLLSGDSMSSLDAPSSSSRAARGLPDAEQQQRKVEEVRELLGSSATAMPYFVTDALIRRFLAHRSWKPQKASKAMREAIKWRLEYKPEAIRWEDIAEDAKAGAMYKADYTDKHGRTVLVIRPGIQPKRRSGPRSSSPLSCEQMRCFVYHLENAMMSAAADGGAGQGQEQAVLLCDFHGWTLSTCPSIRDASSGLHIMQNYYPGMVGLLLLHSPPRIFQVFWKLLRPFLDDATYALIKFVYGAGDPRSGKVMADTFDDVGALEVGFGGKNTAGFDVVVYGRRMREEDRRMEAARQNAAAAHGRLGTPAGAVCSTESIPTEGRSHDDDDEGRQK